MSDVRATSRRPVRIGFRTSIIAVFIAAVLVVGLTLVYLSFRRVSSITQMAASTFIDKVGQLGADRIDAQFKNVRDNLDILAGLPAIQEADIADNSRLYALLASMLRNNPQIFNLYVGYEDGSFLEMDVIDRAKPQFRAALNVDADAVYRVVVIARTGAAAAAPVTLFLSENLIQVGEVAGPDSYDPRQRPWYVEAFKDRKTLLTGPYVFYATGEPGYTLRIPLKEGRRGVVAADLLLNRLEEMLSRQKLGKSGLAFLFNDADRIVGHPEMRDLMAERRDALPRIDALKLPGLSAAIQSWRSDGRAQQFFTDADGRTLVAAFHRIETAGTANIRLAVVAPLDEFFAQIISERRALFAIALGFVAAMLPFAFWLGSLLARSLRELARQTDEIQRFQLADRPRMRSAIGELDELGRSVFTMRTVVRNFSSFIPQPIVRQLMASGASLQLGGVRREVTVLFTDVADFTAKTEKADPSQVMIFTSRYFAAMSEAIMKHHGTIDKFIGDAVMALWNAPDQDPDHVIHACEAVLDCLQRNAELNRAFRSEGWPAYTTRFGLHLGDAVVGNVGSADRMNYTALGATINLASRLEGLNKNYGTQVLVSAAVRARAEHKFAFRSVDQIRPKGFAEAITVYELRGARGDSELTFCACWEAVYAAIRGAEPATALLHIADFLAEYPGDGVAQYHAERLRGIFPQPLLDHPVH
ncbi:MULTISPECIES: adenylate/guanylate cyclase domain-containing protein [unclassified Bradyrhizobium]|uniref:adenylate/guanylate cyclase domain-containing protein n=1 Tax=unclassified Bradyrhizobium TaxID=2631580 RepID=UPI0004278441|nr:MULTISPECIES: adenylate/guanylate cyclase domain-containing protein [unclassified Bradyrhizobium]QIG93134.1 adenylate/guanylate cyclase domain-containing protein [Bradyrhizobium sp. 6(2017)]